MDLFDGSAHPLTHGGPEQNKKVKKGVNSFSLLELGHPSSPDPGHRCSWFSGL